LLGSRTDRRTTQSKQVAGRPTEEADSDELRADSTWNILREFNPNWEARKCRYPTWATWRATSQIISRFK
ncbi:hypothetical protein C3007_09925, partial [Avibacterium gallinarum]